MNNTLHIRRFRPADAPTLAALVERTLAPVHIPEYTPIVLRRMSAELSPSRLIAYARQRLILIGERDGEIVGTGSLQQHWIHALLIEPQQQGQGIGKAILSALERHAMSEGRARVRLYAMLGAVDFYEKYGYHAVQEHDTTLHGRLLEMHHMLVDEPST